MFILPSFMERMTGYSPSRWQNGCMLLSRNPGLFLLRTAGMPYSWKGWTNSIQHCFGLFALPISNKHRLFHFTVEVLLATFKIKNYKYMKNYDSLVDALDDLRKRGYIAD